MQGNGRLAPSRVPGALGLAGSLQRRGPAITPQTAASWPRLLYPCVPARTEPQRPWATAAAAGVPAQGRRGGRGVAASTRDTQPG